ncbi:protein app1-like [Fundulus heteroclitus]|uniref:protein app1-like n=1 Tax=Fundulus heteroclitus TaxID=8078 RepID=UPI00165A4143|nr:protein app1-like [Fundulus heteroclitus]
MTRPRVDQATLREVWAQLKCLQRSFERAVELIGAVAPHTPPPPMTTLRLTVPSLLSPESAAESPAAASHATAQVCVGVVHASTPGTEGSAPPTSEGPAPLPHATAEACVGARTAASFTGVVHSTAPGTEGPIPPMSEGPAPLPHATAEACVSARTAAVRPDAVHSRAPSTGVPAAHATALVCVGVHAPAPVVTEMPAPPVVLKRPEIPVVLKRPEIPVVLKRPEIPVILKRPEIPVILKRPEIPVILKRPEIPVVLKPSATQPPSAPDPAAEPLPWLLICSWPHSSSLNSPAPPGQRLPLRPLNGLPPPGRPPELSVFFPRTSLC